MILDWNSERPRHIHLTGVGGISMSGLASILLHYGFTVSGSDIKPSLLTENLEKRGLHFFPQHEQENINSSDLVVYTAAVKEDNPELLAAREKGIKTMERSTFLGKLMEDYRIGIAVAGTHGKTTTTAMLSTIFTLNSLDPTILLGGEMELLHGNYRIGQKDYFITEACEYRDTFLKMNPDLAIVLNMDNDHLDYFGSMEGIHTSFRSFMERVPQDGHLIIHHERELVQLSRGLKTTITTYGLEEEAFYRACEIERGSSGESTFTLYEGERRLGPIQLKVPGDHNIQNSLAAIATARIQGIEMERIQESIQTFTGTKRRFQIKGTYRDSLIIDDYAHHPREITATLQGARTVQHKRLLVVFQPHLYSRTRLLLKDFALALVEADQVIITEIYGAREIDRGEVSSRDLVEKIERLGGEAIYIPTFEKVIEYLQEEIKKGDMVLTMGAGDIHQVGEKILSL